MAKLTNKKMVSVDDGTEKKKNSNSSGTYSPYVAGSSAYANKTGEWSLEDVAKLYEEYDDWAKKNSGTNSLISGKYAAASPDYARNLAMNPTSNALASQIGKNALASNLAKQADNSSPEISKARTIAMNPTSNPLQKAIALDELKKGVRTELPQIVNAAAVPKVGDVQNNTTGSGTGNAYNLTGAIKNTIGNMVNNGMAQITGQNKSASDSVNASGANSTYAPQAYVKSQSVIDAENMLASQLANLNASRNANTDRINGIISQLENRNFSYDPNSDMLYQQYLATMKNNGLRAMKDTMGQAAALTGGYGSTYATQAANGAYNQYLSQANDNLADFYSMARNNYDADTQALLSRLNVAQNQDEIEYQRALDAYNAALKNLTREDENYWNQKEWDFNQQKYADSRADAEWEKALSERQYNDKLAQQGLENSLAQQEWAYKLAQNGFNPDMTVNQDYMALADANNASSTKNTTTTENEKAYKYIQNFDAKGFETYINNLAASGKDLTALDEFLTESTPVIKKTKEGKFLFFDVNGRDKMSVDNGESMTIGDLGLTKDDPLYTELEKWITGANVGDETSLYELMLSLAE